MAEIFIIADMGGLQHFQMRVVFAGAIPFNDFMPDSIDKGVEVLNLHGGNPIYINLNVRKKLDKVLMSGKLTEQTVVNPTAFQKCHHQALLKGQRKYTVPLGTDPLGNIIRLDNSLNNFPERITAAENELTTLYQQRAAAQIEVEKPFPQEEELAEKSARLAELNAQLDVDEKSHEPEQDEEEQEDAPRRPSVLAALEEKSDKTEPVKPFRSYYDKDGDAR